MLLDFGAAGFVDKGVDVDFLHLAEVRGGLSSQGQGEGEEETESGGEPARAVVADGGLLHTRAAFSPGIV